MKLYLVRPKTGVDATVEYDSQSKTFTVLKGSKVSSEIKHSEKFRGAKSIEKARGDGVVVDCIVTKNVVFKSSSTAANFVTGASTNGLEAWKNEAGESLKTILAGKD